jgi:hypothetical protein
MTRTRVMQRGVGVNEIKNHFADLVFIVPPPGPLDVFEVALFSSVGGVYLSSALGGLTSEPHPWPIRNATVSSKALQKTRRERLKARMRIIDN